jgi:4-amino-4-deoxy-L-arabinose transferase-like glycosyltransferase
MALYPHLIYFGTWLIAESLYMALLALALWLAVRLQSAGRNAQAETKSEVRTGWDRWPGWAGLGILLGLGILAKPSSLMLVPLVALWALVAFPSTPLAGRLGRGLLVVGAAAAIVLPWTARNYAVFGEWVPVSTNGGYTFYGANNEAAFGGHREGFPPRLPGLSEPEEEREYYRLALAWIGEHPAEFARLALVKLRRLLSPLSVASTEEDYALVGAGLVRGLYGAFLLLALAGFVVTLARWRSLLVLYLLIVRVVASALLFYGDARYTLPMVPALVILAAAALTWAWHRVEAHRAARELSSTGGILS